MWKKRGKGIPLLCLHTAGADTRQYRRLLNDPRVTDHFRIITFDMPWHGKTSPPAGWQDRDYKLTASDYMRIIIYVCDALEFDKPVVIGCPIGGRIVLHFAYEHPDRFRALIGLESGAYAEAYYDLAWLNRPDVHGGMVCAGVISGLVAPAGAPATVMKGLGHFPMSEDHEKFVSYLLPVLEQFEAQ